MADIIVAEDEESIREGLVLALQAADHIVRAVSDGAEALAEYRVKRPDLILLDVMMPKKNGYDVCKAIRKKDPLVPILFLTAKTTESCTVHGLELGADDYIHKPFNLRELMARVTAVLRRAALSESAGNRTLSDTNEESPAVDAQSGGCKVKDVFSIGNRTVDPKRMLLLRVGQNSKRAIKLTPSEVEFLALLASAPGRVFSREEITNVLVGEDYFEASRSVDKLCQRLRDKLGPRYGRLIETVYGAGFRYKMKGKIRQ